MNKERKRYPINGTFELTGRCNLSCKMCLVRVDNARIRELELRERTADEWIHMAEQAAKAGTLELLLTGGEVMLRPDFCEIYEAIAKMGFLLTVYTNATMVTDRIMDVFRKLPPHKIGVTMYGASNETYRRLCGCTDGYDRFVDGVQQLSSLPSMLDTRTTIVQDNVDDLAAMQAFTKEHFGADKVLHISSFVMNRIRGGIANPLGCRLDPERHIRMLFPEIIDRWKKTSQGLLPQIERKDIQKYRRVSSEGNYLFASCNAGIDSYAINWSGRMYACELLNEGFTEPFDIGFQRAWELLPQQYPLDSNIAQCDSCEYAYICSSCPAYRLGESGDWFGVPDYACDMARFLHGIIQDVQEKLPEQE